MKDSRLEALRSLMEEQGLDVMLVSKLVHLQYFSGFRGDSAVLLIGREKALLVTDSRYTEQAAQQAPRYEIVEQKDGLWQQASECMKQLGAKVVGFESNDMVYRDYERLSKLLEHAELKPCVLDHLRQIKDEEEIACIRKACEIADRAFADILKYIRPGISELAVAAHMENCMRELGSEGPSFTTIVASGLRGSMPHGIATEKLIVSGEFVTMDYGAVYAGYHSDITRTICVGHADEKQRRIYGSVLRAQTKALSAIRPGASGKSVDAVARDVLAEDGLAQYFGHGLGHSLGLEIHEEPRLSPKSACEHLVRNMLVTDEPGVYIPGWGGLRIEDTVLVTEQGSMPLTASDKQLIEL
ncbi:MAG: aminopeptidase P family protein [Selenomonadaceae bacterium]|nr:aminopeptidase P family protein [Selenomonadaceae bacterium]